MPLACTGSAFLAPAQHPHLGKESMMMGTYVILHRYSHALQHMHPANLTYCIQAACQQDTADMFRVLCKFPAAIATARLLFGD